VSAPESFTSEQAAWRYVTTTSLEDKLAGPDHADAWEPSSRLDVEGLAPGRPPELEVVDRAPRFNHSIAALRRPERRAELLHTFMHHELQAAELMCWAVLAFPDTPLSFRRGLMAICRDEIRHMAMYREHLSSMGYDFGAFPVRDWFWQRVPSCRDPRTFVATLGIGFEGGNLDHTRRFAARFRAAGDEAGAALQERVGREEVAHVRFALRWYRAFTNDAEVDFDAWRLALPAPLSPILMRGRPMDRERRETAGMSAAFVDALDRWREEP
jgi:uncharacterized ferritin-like protein (DUF455 family)